MAWEVKKKKKWSQLQRPIVKKEVTFLVSAVHVLLRHLPIPPQYNTQARLVGPSKVCSGGV